MTIALGSEGVITCWDETLQQCFSFTPNDVAINDDVSVRTVPPRSFASRRASARLAVWPSRAKEVEEALVVM
jgi:hypothetical protein